MADNRRSIKFQRLEAVRGFAALYVCLTHVFHLELLPWFARLPLSFGQEAVILFFVLSGFVIQWSAGGHGQDGCEPFGRYFLKRFIRIYSVWACAVVALCMISWIEQGHFVHQPAGQWLGNLLMLQDWRYGHPATICDPLYGDTPLWSLHYEWWFYMLFPMMNACASREHRVHLVGVLAFTNAILYAWLPNPISRLFIYLSIWWIGVHAADRLRSRGAVHFRDLYWPLAYAALTALPGLFVAVRWWMGGNAISLGTHPVAEPRHLLGAIIMVIGAFTWRWADWFGFSATIGRFAVLAPISFSLYVIHYRSIGVATYLSFIGNRWVEMLSYVVLTLLFCVMAELVCYPWIRRIVQATATGSGSRPR